MSAIPPPDPQSLQGPLLAAVSRSFYLSLRFLPPPVRGPLSVSYLLARAADTIADVAASPAAERLNLLAEFRAAVGAPVGVPVGVPSSGGISRPADSPGIHNDAVPRIPPEGGTPTQAPDFRRSVTAFAARVDHAGERELLERLEECFTRLGKLTPGSQEKVSTVLGHILDGMTLDLKRFPDAATLRSLTTDGELEDYTWLVAGCVGEFWTAICAAELPGVFTRPEAEMTALGSRFGKGLQLINILRDQAGDAAIGRCYLPAEALAAAGLPGAVVWPAVDWHPWHAVRRDLIARARTYLADGWNYAASQRSMRLRFATLMPLLIGEGTLTRMEALPPDGPPAAVKVTRREVKRYARRALWMALTGRIKPC